MIASRLASRSATVLVLATAFAAWLGPIDLRDVGERWRVSLGSDVDQPSLAGAMLVAAPDLDDPYFNGARIYLLLHDSEGAVGVVLNRSHGHAGVSEGGPVGRDQVIVLVDEHAAPRGSLRVGSGVSVLTEPEHLDDEIVLAHARVFVGYAGWGPGQLEGEIARGAWRIEPGTAAEALDDPFDP
jgi:putative AlgH/UPF0301 family transcriptional regulator